MVLSLPIRCAPHGGQETKLGKERTAGASIVGFLEVFFFFWKTQTLIILHLDIYIYQEHGSHAGLIPALLMG